ncbi:MAG: ATP-binding protein [Opitutales bacterium]|nr:ATP-binding protein [Opitutales bacterium]
MAILKTYRIELVALTMLVSALSLAAFGLISWRIIYQEKQSQVDLRLESAAGRYAAQIFTKGHPPRRDAMFIADNMDEINQSSIGMAIIHYRDGLRWSNKAWPDGIKLFNYREEVLELTRLPEDAPGESGRPRPRLSETPPGERERQRPRLSENANESRERPRPRFLPREEEFDSNDISADQGRPLPNKGRPEGLIGYQQTRFETITLNNEHIRMLILPADRTVMLFALNLSQIESEMKETSKAFYLALPLAVLLSGIGAFLLAGRALGPVRKLSKSAQSVNARGLDHRIEKNREHLEFSRLIDVYNAMLDRLEKSFTQAKRFSADAAHELNTPLTILHGHLDDAIQSASAGSPDQERYVMLMEEVTLLRDIVDKLLMLSKADGGRLRIDLKPVEFSTLVESVLEDAEVMADHLSFAISIDLGLEVNGDAQLLRQLVLNLLSNAIKYNREKGIVSVRLTSNSDEVVLSMTNTGEQIPNDKAEQLFERFYRVDSARNRKKQGLGLGLSLAREIAVAHNADLILAENVKDRITFELRMKIA